MPITSAHLRCRQPLATGRDRGWRSAGWLLALCLLMVTLFARTLSAQSLEQGGPVDFGSSPVGASSGKITLNFNATVPTNISGVSVVTEGAQNLDFTLIQQNCVGEQAPPETCLITLQFTPSQVGLRKGWLSLTDSTGTIVNNVPLRGIGQGPLMLLTSPLSASATTSVSGPSPSSFLPTGSVLDGSGNLYVNDLANSRLLEIAPNGTATVLGTVSGTGQSSLAINGFGTVFVSSPGQHTVYFLVPGGTLLPLLTPGVTLVTPTGLAVDGSGYLYISDAGNNTIVRVAMDQSSASALTLTGLAVPLANPMGLTVDLNDNLYIADAGNNRIVQFSLSTGQAAPVAVSGLTLSSPAGVAISPSGTLTVADAGNSRFVSISAAGQGTALNLQGVTITQPAGVTFTDSGDLVLTDLTAGLITLPRNAATYTYPTATQVGSLDATDGNLAITVADDGNTVLQFQIPNGGTNPSQSGVSYNLGAMGTTCPVIGAGQSPSASNQLGVDATCTYLLSFTPLNTGPNPSTATIAGGAVGGGLPSSLTLHLNGTGLSKIDHFVVTVAPSVTTIGTTVSVTVTAIDNTGAVYTGYLGHIVFTATDPLAAFLFGTGYTFSAADQGTHTFAAPGTGMTFGSLGTFYVSVADDAYTGTSNPVQVIQQAVASTFTATPNPVLAGSTVTLSISFASGNSSLTSATPTGTVQFSDGASVLGSTTLSNGSATYTATFTQAGQHQLSATYSGDSKFLGATATTALTVADFTLAVAQGAPSSGSNKRPGRFRELLPGAYPGGNRQSARRRHLHRYRPALSGQLRADALATRNGSRRIAVDVDGYGSGDNLQFAAWASSGCICREAHGVARFGGCFRLPSSALAGLPAPPESARPAGLPCPAHDGWKRHDPDWLPGDGFQRLLRSDPHGSNRRDRRPIVVRLNRSHGQHWQHGQHGSNWRHGFQRHYRFVRELGRERFHGSDGQHRSVRQYGIQWWDDRYDWHQRQYRKLRCNRQFRHDWHLGEHREHRSLRHDGHYRQHRDGR